MCFHAGGIQRYIEQYPSGGFFRGSLFVFDPRVLVPAGPLAEDIGFCLACGASCGDYAPRLRCSRCRMLVLICGGCAESSQARRLCSSLVCTKLHQFLTLVYYISIFWCRNDHILQVAMLPCLTDLILDYPCRMLPIGSETLCHCLGHRTFAVNKGRTIERGCRTAQSGLQELKAALTCELCARKGSPAAPLARRRLRILCLHSFRSTASGALLIIPHSIARCHTVTTKSGWNTKLEVCCTTSRAYTPTHLRQNNPLSGTSWNSEIHFRLH